MKSLEALTQVYSYMFPEVRKTVFHNEGQNDNGHSSRLFLSPKEMDAVHEPIIQKYVDNHLETLPGLGNFSFRYPTAGSEEGIREFMTKLALQGVKKFYVLNGEYEGYKFVGQTRGMGAVEVFNPDFSRIRPGWFFISNPSARDGNIIPNQVIDEICMAGHKVFYDLAYVDSTEQHSFDLTNPGIRTAVCSFSKPYGMFYFRVGFAFSREEIPSLYGNKWFKVVPSLLDAQNVMEQIDPKQLHAKYMPFQKKIVQEINRELGLNLSPSDALLLAHLTSENSTKLDAEQRRMLAPFSRGGGYRLCLKPYYEKLEKAGAFGYKVL